MAVVQLGSVPVAQYALPGSEAVADSVAPYCRDYNGLLLAHHGVVSWGENVFQAFYRLESIEYYAKVTLYSKLLGEEKLLSTSQVDELIALRPKWGITTGGKPRSE